MASPEAPKPPTSDYSGAKPIILLCGWDFLLATAAIVRQALIRTLGLMGITVSPAM